MVNAECQFKLEPSALSLNLISRMQQMCERAAYNGMWLTFVVAELVLVQVVNFRMRFQQIVTAQVAGNSRIGERWSHVVQSVGLLTYVPWFIEGRPHFHAIAKLLDQNFCVVDENVDQLLIGPTTEFL